MAFLEPIRSAFSPVNFHQFKSFGIINANILCSHFRKDEFNAIGILQSCFLIKRYIHLREDMIDRLNILKRM